MNTNTYDIIIAGAGLSGLSLAYYLAEAGYKGNVLLVDKSFAPVNKKTWCFWTKETPPFHDIVYHEWRKAYFSAFDFSSFLYMRDHSYYCIRESDFKEYILTKLYRLSNFHLLEEGILDFSSSQKKAILLAKNSDTYVADFIFQSMMKPDSAKKVNLKYPIIQHFLGVEIAVEKPIFDSTTFTIMHLDEDFDDGFAFMYVLPYDRHRALFEFTVFSESTLKKKKYRKKIKAFLKKHHNLKKSDYTVLRTEKGKIPMDDRPFSFELDKGIFNIGTMGGFTKASTGYTFLRVQKASKLLARQIVKGTTPSLKHASPARFKYYDKLLLHILSTSTPDSQRVFYQLFKNNHIDKVFDFLNEDTNFFQDLKIMASVPPLPFLKAISKNLSR